MSIRIYAKDKSVSYRVSRYWWQEKAYLTLTAQLLIDTSTGHSLPDRVLWEHTAKELRKIQAGANFDQGKAKVNAEFFVGGYAFAYDEHTSISSVQVEVGSLKKTAAVYGDRYWLKSGPIASQSTPLPFKHIALSWHNTFGGKTCPLNPKGKGQTADEQGLWPLANIEDPHCILGNPHQTAEPMGFLPTHLTPQQRKRLGTFDEQWLKKAWPYVPQDHDMHYWNVAPQDQQQPQFWTGKERITCTHLHPTKPVLHFELQQQTIRAFYQKKNQSPEEMALDFDTIWLFPHLEQALLIWHGTIPICDETAFDIEAMLLVEENKQTGTLSFEHYIALLQDKIQRKPPPFVAKEPKPPRKLKSNSEAQKKAAEHKAKLAAKSPSPQDKPGLSPQEFDALLADRLSPENLARYQALMAKKSAESLVSHDPKLTPTENLNNVAAFAEQQMAPEAKKLWQEAQKNPIPPPDFKTIKEKLIADAANIPTQEKHTITAEQLTQWLDELETNNTLHQKLLAKPLKTPLSLDEKIAQAILQKCFKEIRIVGHRFESQTFDHIDFTTIHFQNCQFQDCRFNHCVFDKVFFELCTLQKSHFTSCSLTGLRWSQVHLADNQFFNCTFDQWYFTQNTYQHLVFEQCLFKNGREHAGHWQLCQFKQCQESNNHYKKTGFNALVWQNSDLTRVYFDDCSFRKVEFNHSSLKSVNVNQCVLQHAHFHACQSQAFSFVHCQLTVVSFKQVNMQNLTVRNCEWTGWQVVDSDLSKLLCVQSALTDLEFSQSNFYNSRYKTLTRFDNANFQRLNLQKSFFENSPLDHGQILHCDLTQSVWHRCQIDNGTFSANLATLSRFEDCDFIKSRLYNNNYFQASFKRSLFKQTEIVECNLVRVNFYHASSDQLSMQRCLLPDPLPIGFWERWQEARHE